MGQTSIKNQNKKQSKEKKSECPPGILVTPGVPSPESRKFKDFPGGLVVGTEDPLQGALV